MAKNIKGRKFVATAASAALVASAIVPVASAAVEFSDAGQISDYAKDAVNYLVGEEIINGLGDGSFGPQGEITRAQAATIFTKALKLDTTGTENFSDVNADDWFFSAVVGVANAGIVNGMGDGTFAPENKLTRAQAAKMIVEAYKLTGKADLAKYTDATDLQTWASDALAIAVENGIMKGNSDTTLNPEGNITREDFAVMVKRAIDATQKETETKEIAVTSVSAINATLVTVELSGDVPAGLSKENIKISNGVTVNSVSVTGKKIQVTTSELPANTSLTLSFTGVESLASASKAFTYNQAVVLESAVEGFVNLQAFNTNGTPKYDAAGDPVYAAAAGITVSAGGYTTKTDANGYYKLPVQAGLVEVTVKSPSHYDSVEDVVVVDKKVTSNVINMDAILISELEIVGTIKDEATGKPVTTASVQLEQKVDGKWVAIGEEIETTDGTYAFGNSANETAYTAGTNNSLFTNVYGEAIDLITTSGEYRVVATKDSLENGYHQKEVAVKVNTKSPQTIAPVSLTAVKAVEKLELAYTFNPNVADADALASAITTTTTTVTTKPVSLTIVGENGQSTVLATSAAIDLTKNNETGIYTGKTNLVDAIKTTLTGATKVTLKSGKYFLKVNDGENAIQVIPFTVTEGTNGSYSVAAKKAQDLSVSSLFETYPTGLTVTAGDITGDVKLWKTVNGVDVLVAESLVTDGDGLDYLIDATTNKLSADVDVNRLEATGYKVTLNGKYILGAPAKAVTVAADSTSQTNVEVKGGGAIESTIQFRNAADSADLALAAKTSHKIKATVKDEAGKVVATHDLSFAVKVDGTLNRLDDNAAVSYGFGAANDELVVTFNQLVPGKYTVEYTSENFKSDSTNETTVKMFEDATNSAKLIATPSVVLAGAITFADHTNATPEKVLVFNEKGGLAATFTTSNATFAAGSYEIDFGTLPAGKYKLVFYGDKFETIEQDVTVVKGENTKNVTVVKGGEAKVDFNIFDSNGVRLSDSEIGLTFTDAYKTSFTLPTSWTNGEVSTATELSKGNFVLSFEGASAGKYKAGSATVTVDRINGTINKTVTVDLVNSGKTYEVAGSVDVSKIVSPATLEDVIVVVKNAVDGSYVTSQVATVNASGAYDYAFDLSNGSYVISVFENGSFVADKAVQVKDVKVSDVDFILAPASR